MGPMAGQRPRGPGGGAGAGTSPLLAPLEELRRRLDALREGRVEAPRWWDRLLSHFMAPGEAIGALPVLTALSRALDHVGVHTLADAQLLRALAQREGREVVLARGLERQVRAALAEVEGAVRRAERALLVGRPLAGSATALDEHLRGLVRAARVADAFRQPVHGPWEQAAGAFVLLPPVAARPAGPPASARLAVVEYLEARARAEVADVAQKRRDLDVASEVLLRLGTEMDRERTRAVRHTVVEARARTRAMSPTRTLTALSREVRQTTNGEPRAAYRALHGLYTRALEAGEETLARHAWGALSAMLPELDGLAPSLARAWLLEAPGERHGAAPERADAALVDLAFQLNPEQARQLELAAGCARFVDVEDALAETVLEAPSPELRPVARRVPYPTQRMELATTGSLHEVQHFVLTDPRRMLYDLASHRQLVRAYLEEAPPEAPRRVRRSSVRVYVCDASGSMHGARARFRDALLLAELQALRARARRGQPVDPLYFCFFNHGPSALVRVDSADAAARQMEQLFRASPAEGQTDITLALLSAFDSIRAAQGQDPSLARATVVLVTDGEDRVDLVRIREGRAPLSSVSIALSFLSLGEENPDLKALVMEQRARGERAFYLHLSDDDLRWGHGAFSMPWRTLLPPDVPVRQVRWETLLPHLEALEALARGRPPAAVRPPDGAFDAHFPERATLKPGMHRGVTPAVAERVADVLEAVLETATLTPAEGRAGESVQLLTHLREVYGLSLADYLDALAAGGERIEAALARVRLLCRPLG